MKNYIYYGYGDDNRTLYLSSIETDETPRLYMNYDDIDFPWCVYTYCIEQVVFLNKITTITSMSHMFCRCYRLTNLDMSNFNTSQVTDMSGMFYGCVNLTNLDISNFDTSNVTDMSEMFGR